MWPSILILMGALGVKKRSDARFSTMSLKSGLVLKVVAGGASVANGPLAPSAGCCPVISSSSGSTGSLVDNLASLAGMRLNCPPLLFLDDVQIAGIVNILHFALALELHAQSQLVLRVGITQGILVGDHARFKQLKERLIE